jgi:hypothetical protein
MLRVLHDIPLYFQRLTSADGGCMRHTCDMSRVLQPIVIHISHSPQKIVDAAC